jgi:hypothetical protein
MSPNPFTGAAQQSQMPSTARHDAMILAVDAATLSIGAELLRRLRERDDRAAESSHDSPPLDWPLLVVSGVGEVLRAIHRDQPRGLFVCVGLEQLEAAAALIQGVRARRARLPQVALVSEHDQRIERAVRIAGAACYFPLSDRLDEALLERALTALGMIAAERAASTTPPTGLSPPALQVRARASPAPPTPIAHSRDRPG